MVEITQGPRKHLALDTDWMTALNVSFGLIFSSTAAVGLTWSLLHTTMKAVSPSWSSPLVAALYIYMGIRDSRWVFRVVVFTLALGPVSHVILWLFRASPETRVLNEVFIRCSWIGLCVVGFVYIIYWFSTKIKYV